MELEIEKHMQKFRDGIGYTCCICGKKRKDEYEKPTAFVWVSVHGYNKDGKNYVLVCSEHSVMIDNERRLLEADMIFKRLKEKGLVKKID